jgi:hypothetical protein
VSNMKSNLKTYLNLFLLVMVFVLPMIASELLYLYRQHINFKTLNHGVIINPPIDVKFLYQSMNNASEKKWRLLQVTDDVCDAQCVKELYQLGQVKKILGKDRDRVLVVSMGGKFTKLQQLNHLFAQHGEKDFSVKNKIYLIDPLGNLFMYYPAAANPMNILKDMQRVLEVSQIG